MYIENELHMQAGLVSGLAYREIRSPLPEALSQLTALHGNPDRPGGLALDAKSLIEIYEDHHPEDTFPSFLRELFTVGLTDLFLQHAIKNFPHSPLEIMGRLLIDFCYTLNPRIAPYEVAVVLTYYVASQLTKERLARLGATRIIGGATVNLHYIIGAAMGEAMSTVLYDSDELLHNPRVIDQFRSTYLQIANSESAQNFKSGFYDALRIREHHEGITHDRLTEAEYIPTIERLISLALIESRNNPTIHL